MWNKVERIILDSAIEILERSKGSIPTDKETWWWSKNIPNVMKKKFIKNVKKAVTMGKDSNEREGQKIIYKLEKARDRVTKDITKTKIIKDVNEEPICDEEWF
ncbi:uncharacterized protein LOC106461585 [Limulus polyphemus]|uniref:Uncharacterized protein LOC106461585 n=1 Tax=Limulus polyphemus TaxID=6850 RepID=A0ABM1B8D0_LIMPO|nr:uncharacterized protein LOC106461585 [Limulus polyphemus]